MNNGAHAMTNTAPKFEVGKSYATRSICDSDTWMRVTILKRTDKTVTVKRGDKTKVCKIAADWQGYESIKPWGSYSMCPVISSCDEGKGEVSEVLNDFNYVGSRHHY
jgi:hypothetical protein